MLVTLRHLGVYVTVSDLDNSKGECVILAILVTDRLDFRRNYEEQGARDCITAIKVATSFPMTANRLSRPRETRMPLTSRGLADVTPAISLFLSLS